MKARSFWLGGWVCWWQVWWGGGVGACVFGSSRTATTITTSNGVLRARGIVCFCRGFVNTLTTMHTTLLHTQQQLLVVVVVLHSVDLSP